MPRRARDTSIVHLHGEGISMLAHNNTDIAFHPRATIFPDGSVEGYASLFGEIDQSRDMVMPGAFTQSLKLRGARRVPMLFQHDPAEPIGIWLDLQEDWRGLRVRGKLIPEVVRARELLALLREGTSDGLSIGFKTVQARVDPKTRVRKLHQIDLWEISIVTFPLLPGARVRAVKQARRTSLAAPAKKLARLAHETELAREVRQLFRGGWR
jgi:HK97 family phage prohead protease